MIDGFVAIHAISRSVVVVIANFNMSTTVSAIFTITNGMRGRGKNAMNVVSSLTTSNLISSYALLQNNEQEAPETVPRSCAKNTIASPYRHIRLGKRVLCCAGGALPKKRGRSCCRRHVPPEQYMVARLPSLWRSWVVLLSVVLAAKATGKKGGPNFSNGSHRAILRHVVSVSVGRCLEQILGWWFSRQRTCAEGSERLNVVCKKHSP